MHRHRMQGLCFATRLSRATSMMCRLVEHSLEPGACEGFMRDEHAAHANRSQMYTLDYSEMLTPFEDDW
jgi:hypothetical protein